MKTSLILLTLLHCMAVATAQSLNPETTYRITAVQAGEPTIESQSNELDLGLGIALHLPTAFTPNNDGLNDTFGVVGQGIEDFQLVIFDRWGNEVFASTTAEARWDGHWNGQPLPQGAYSYKATATNRYQQGVVKVGSVMLLNN